MWLYTHTHTHTHVYLANRRGITLIALIITIIVMLILAGVVISLSTGNSSVIERANSANKENEKRSLEESIQVSYIFDENTGKLKLTETKEAIEQNLRDAGYTDISISGTDFPIEVKAKGKTGTHTFYVLESGEITEDKTIIGKEDLEEVTLADAQSDAMLSRTKSAKVSDTSGKQIVLPAGFKILVDSTTGYTSTNISVTQGIVITDGTSEFVWIPVTDLTKFARATSGTDANGRTNYRGVLYDWNTDATGNTEYSWSADSTDFREPANLSSTYDSTSNISSWTPTLYQEIFNKMVESVAKYKGFYVGRYETSLNGTTVQSKSGLTPMNNINWYEMYNNSKTYSSSNENLGVESEMIWGCQWDAMLKFILANENYASHVTATNNVSHDLSDIYYTGGTNYTGTVTYNDKAANIYDLEGNVYEWTQEALDTYSRVNRGGRCSDRGASLRRDFGNFFPNESISYIGSRLALYIK
ncbi:MAG: hypothetical protein ACI4UE_06805 [Candidatus Scatovivens sp.]